MNGVEIRAHQRNGLAIIRKSTADFRCPFQRNGTRCLGDVGISLVTDHLHTIQTEVIQAAQNCFCTGNTQIMGSNT